MVSSMTVVVSNGKKFHNLWNKKKSRPFPQADNGTILLTIQLIILVIK